MKKSVSASLSRFGVSATLALLSCLGTFSPAMAETVTPHRIFDRFAANAVDSTVWWYGTNQPDQIAISEGDGHVTFNVSGSATNDFNASLGTRCSARGDFDARVSFNLSAWPAADGVWVSLMASGTPFNTYRASASWFDSYGTYLPPAGDVVPAAGNSGTLRLARVGSLWTGYYLADHRWIAIASGIGPSSDFGLTIAVFNLSGPTPFGGQPATIEINEFRVFADEIVCT